MRNIISFFKTRISLNCYRWTVVFLCLSTAALSFDNKSQFFKEIWINRLLKNELIFLTNRASPEVQVNGYTLQPSFSKDIKTYEAITLNTLTNNVFEVDNIIKPFQVKHIKPDTFIGFVINGEKYQLRVRPQTLPPLKVENLGASRGDILTSLFNGTGTEPSFAVMMDIEGNLKFYHANPIQKLNISDFKKYVLPNGKTRYTFMQQTKKMPPWAYWYGKIILLDENFQKIKELTQIASNPQNGLIENHESLLLDDNHYILSRYQNEEIYINDLPSKIVALVLQEIKDGKVIFEWNSRNYPELLEESLDACAYQTVYQDYLHFNSLIIDPKDNNLIVSFKRPSTIYKINRKTGAIMWRLGGKKDEFGLSPKQVFTNQHTATLTQDGFIMVYDNHTDEINSSCLGSFKYYKQNHSRILKFKIDEESKKLLDFQEIPLKYHSIYMGSVFETGTDSYIVGYGTASQAAAEEINSNGKVLWRFKLPDTLKTYRVYKYSSQ